MTSPDIKHTMKEIEFLDYSFRRSSENLNRLRIQRQSIESEMANEENNLKHVQTRLAHLHNVLNELLTRNNEKDTK